MRADTELLLDATDAEGRCHDQGDDPLGVSAPRGGLEIIDVTDPSNPVEIGLGDFRLSDGGRNAVDIYKVTLPAPPRPR